MLYTIKFLSDWHIGSGLSAGALSDTQVLKDENKLPYIPGKTIKGLLKDALFEMPAGQVDRALINKLFGYEEKDAEGNVSRTHQGCLRFSNAILSKEEQREISPELAEHLYRHYTSTSINKKGVAKSQSLRTMEICIPLELKGEISFIQNEQVHEAEEIKKIIELMEKGFKWLRRLGVNRNRGLGRCQFILIDKKF